MCRIMKGTVLTSSRTDAVSMNQLDESRTITTPKAEACYLSSLSQLKTCPKCEHLVKEFRGDNIHSVLAYSRCRCHRMFVSKMKELRLHFTQEQAKRLSSTTSLSGLNHPSSMQTAPDVMPTVAKDRSSKRCPSPSLKAQHRAHHVSGITAKHAISRDQQDHLLPHLPALSTNTAAPMLMESGSLLALAHCQSQRDVIASRSKPQAHVTLPRKSVHKLPPLKEM